MENLAVKNNVIDEEAIKRGLITVDKFINRTYLSSLSDCQVIELADDEKKTNNIRLFQVDKVVFDDQENNNDKLISVYSAIQNVGASLVLLLRGDATGVKYYIGICDANNVSISEKTLSKSFKANFPGSKLDRKSNSEISEILDEATFSGELCNVSSVTVVPSVRDEDKDKFVQGIEKFIDTMRGEEYSALFISRPIGKSELEERKRNMEEIYTSLSPFVKSTLAYGENDSLAVSEGVSENFSHTVNDSVATTLGTNSSTNQSKTKGTSMGMNLGFSFGSNKGTTTGTSSGSSYSKSETSGTADTTGTSTTKSDTKTTGTSKTLTIESTNKTVDVILKNIDEQIERIKACEAFGIWETAAYFIAEEIQVSIVAANSFKALVSGDSSNVENAYINIWNQHNPNVARLVDYVHYCKHPLLTVKGYEGYSDQIVTPANYISGKEMPLFVGLPQKSVNGVSVSTMAEFGRNVFLKDGGAVASTGRKMPLGKIHHMGVEDEGNTVKLDIDSFTSHCFVTGSTGSGKSNTTYCLLQNFLKNEIPFLVIEPAKGEYKIDFGAVDGINIFTSNPYMGEMLKINPFKFNSNIHILEHLDRLIEIFNACWEMYAAMPAILKSAVEKAYTDKGWDLTNSVYTMSGTPEYPTFSDVLTALPKIIKNTSYSSDSQGDYTGALVTRVESLTNGITGQIFCDSYSIDEKVLFDQNTIVDLSRIGSNETKSLIMGILVMQLTEYRMANAHGTNKALSHVTVLEEAHNLLKNVSQGQSQQAANLVGKSVEMICNSIAEMRTYGEGFVIVDQSPSSVDIAAIKNTNTKIIMRLPEKHDCEAVGNAIGLKENQIQELSKLPVGVAAVMQNNWLEAVLCKVNRAPDNYKKENEKCSYEQIKVFRSKLVKTLLDQYKPIFYSESLDDMHFDIKALNDVINNADVPQYIKKEFSKRLEKINDNLISTKMDGTTERNDLYVCDKIVEILGVSGLMKTSARNIEEDNTQELNDWTHEIENSIGRLIYSNDLSFVTQCVLFSCNCHSDLYRGSFSEAFNFYIR